jgi:hypothetical protein
MLMRLFNLLRPAPPPAPSPPSAAPKAANENLLILDPEDDPAAELSIIRSLLAKMRRDNARQGTLLADPKRRQDYEEGRALERCIEWRFFEWPAPRR